MSNPLTDADIDSLSPESIIERADKILARFRDTGASGSAQAQANFYARCSKSLARRLIHCNRDAEALRNALRIFQESR